MNTHLIHILLLLKIFIMSMNTSTSFLTPTHRHHISKANKSFIPIMPIETASSTTITKTRLAAVPDLNTVALVAGQENYGLAIVAMGEALWSFLEAPSLSHAKVLIPAIIASVLLVLVSGPMITSAGDSVGLGLEISTATAVFLSVSYVARLLAPYSPSAKEKVFLGLLFSIAGFFSFSQNLIVDGFISVPTVELPNLFPKNEFEDY